jgi:hypothetical protein
MHGAIPLLPQYAFMAWCLFEAQVPLPATERVKMIHRVAVCSLRTSGSHSSCRIARLSNKFLVTCKQTSTSHSLLLNGYRGYLPEVKRPERDHFSQKGFETLTELLINRHLQSDMDLRFLEMT